MIPVGESAGRSAGVTEGGAVDLAVARSDLSGGLNPMMGSVAQPSERADPALLKALPAGLDELYFGSVPVHLVSLGRVLYPVVCGCLCAGLRSCRVGRLHLV